MSEQVVSEDVKCVKVSKISLHSDEDAVKDAFEWPTEVFHTPLRSETLSNGKSNGKIRITTDTAVSLHAFKNMAPETKSMTSGFSSSNVASKICHLSTSHPGFRTTYSHYKRSVLRQARCQADNLRLKFAKECRAIKSHKQFAGPLLSTGQRFV
ncbi:unnamed protein product [Schistosoma turkestanicum]|nr:unnamed protein product [Schistosoma turkestanicum]